MDVTSISIIIVHWNVPKLLSDCLASIECERRATNFDIQVIVVDNGSPAGPPAEVVSRFQTASLIALPENRGFATANNLGAREAIGETLLFLNPDTELLPGSLQPMMTALQLNPRVGLVAPLLLNPDGSHQSAGYRFPGIMNVLCDLFPVPARLIESSINGRLAPGADELPYAVDYCLGAAMLMRREAFTDAGGFDEQYFMYAEEVDLCQQLRLHDWTRLIAPRSQVIHYGGQSTAQRSSRMNAELWLSRARYFDRWLTGWRRQVIPRLVELRLRGRGDDREKRQQTLSTFRSIR